MSSDAIAWMAVGFGCGSAFTGLAVVVLAAGMWANVKAEQRRAARYWATVLQQPEVRNEQR